MVNGMVRDLLVALDRSNTVEVLDAVDRLSRYGHTSGLDCVLGVLIGLISAPRAAPTAGAAEAGSALTVDN
jgi:hypothetical protein